MPNEKSNSLYTRAVRFATSPLGLAFLVLWSFSEASFWFIAPDFLIIIFATLKPTNKLKFVSIALIASFAGGILYYLLNLVAFDALGQILLQTPFVSLRTLNLIRSLYNHYGYPGILIQSFSFASFKIWTYLAVEKGFNPLIYFPLVMISRFLRLYLLAWLAASLSKYTKNVLRNHFIYIVVLYTITWFALLIVIER